MANSKDRGELSEAKILAKVLEKGYSVSLPFGDNQRYDMILDDGENLLKAQCKTGHLVNGCISFQVASKNGFTGKRTSYADQIDIFLVYFPDKEEVYRIPIAEAGKNEMRLRIEEPGGKSPKSTIRWAKDYLLN